MYLKKIQQFGLFRAQPREFPPIFPSQNVCTRRQGPVEPRFAKGGRHPIYRGLPGIGGCWQPLRRYQRSSRRVHGVNHGVNHGKRREELLIVHLICHSGQLRSMQWLIDHTNSSLKLHSETFLRRSRSLFQELSQAIEGLHSEKRLRPSGLGLGLVFKGNCVFTILRKLLFRPRSI